MGTATGMGGGTQGSQGGIIIGGTGCGYETFTSMDVDSFLGTITGGFIFTGGGHAAPTHAGAAAGTTLGCGAGIAPVKLPAHTMLAAATTRMNPRIADFLTIPSSSFRQTHISE
jgi:hypothetical protein